MNERMKKWIMNEIYKKKEYTEKYWKYWSLNARILHKWKEIEDVKGKWVKDEDKVTRKREIR